MTLLIGALSIGLILSQLALGPQVGQGRQRETREKAKATRGLEKARNE